MIWKCARPVRYGGGTHVHTYMYVFTVDRAAAATKAQLCGKVISVRQGKMLRAVHLGGARIGMSRVQRQKGCRAAPSDGDGGLQYS